MRLTITIPDDLAEQINHRAEAAGVTRAEWIRQACNEAITTSITELENIIESCQERGHQLQERIDQLTAECDRLQTVINSDHSGDHEITTLRAELQHKDHTIATQRDKILWLRGEVAKLNDKIPMLPAAGDRKWWMFWK